MNAIDADMTTSKGRPSSCELFRWLVDHAKATEWQFHHAAENRYCPYCATEDDAWTDQDGHHEGCEFVRMMKEVEAIIGPLQLQDVSGRQTLRRDC